MSTFLSKSMQGVKDAIDRSNAAVAEGRRLTGRT